jgi:hypothetical protein
MMIKQHVIPVKTGIQDFASSLKTSGFLLEFIPMKIGAGMTECFSFDQ